MCRFLFLFFFLKCCKFLESMFHDISKILLFECYNPFVHSCTFKFWIMPNNYILIKIKFLTFLKRISIRKHFWNKTMHVVPCISKKDRLYVVREREIWGSFPPKYPSLSPFPISLLFTKEDLFYARGYPSSRSTPSLPLIFLEPASPFPRCQRCFD